MRVRGLGRVAAARRRLLGRLLPGPTILLYHRIIELEHDSQLLAVSPRNFSEHVAVLQERYTVLPLGVLVERIATGTAPPNAVAVTFDDGYADNLHEARRLLVRHGLPATVFVAAGYVGAAREFPWDELERLLLLLPDRPASLSLDVHATRHEWNLSTNGAAPTTAAEHGPADPWNVECGQEPTGLHAAYRQIVALFSELDSRSRDELWGQLRGRLGDPGPPRPEYRALTVEELRELASDGLIEIGAHTMTHPMLSALDSAAQSNEIVRSKRFLEDQTGRSVDAFSYPYGTRASYTHETVRIVREAGFRSACSNFRGRMSRRTDPFQLPRFVVRNWTGDEFARCLATARL